MSKIILSIVGLFAIVASSAGAEPPLALTKAQEAALNGLGVPAKVEAPPKPPQGKVTHPPESARPRVIDLDFAKTGLVAKFFTPGSRGPFPALLAYGGSDGGLDSGTRFASALSDRGYAALALAYFDPKGDGRIPKTLENIPLEYFKRALEWVRAQGQVRPDKIGVIGASRGGELSLLLGSVFPEIKAVVAVVPSHVVWSGIGCETRQNSSWMYRGAQVPFVPFQFDLTKTVEVPDGPFKGKQAIQLGPGFGGSVSADPASAERAAIRVENTRGPILLLGGGDDQMWPSCEFGHAAMVRLHAAGHPYPDEFHCYRSAGHIFSKQAPRYLPMSICGRELIFDVGGEPEANEASARDFWPRIERFLARNLR